MDIACAADHIVKLSGGQVTEGRTLELERQVG
jgi:hypothetical protein